MRRRLKTLRDQQVRCEAAAAKESKKICFRQSRITAVFEN